MSGSTRTRRRRAKRELRDGGGLAVLGLAAMALALTATPAHAAKKPDLVIAAPKGHGKEYAYQGSTGNASFTFTTKNTGKARAKATVTRVQLDHADQQLKLGDADVPGLEPVGDKRGRDKS